MRRAGVAAVAVSLALAGCSLDPVDLDAQRPLALRSTFKAADGTVLARFYKENRKLVSLRDVPRSLVRAVIAAEDARFFKHPGFDVKAIARAALANAAAGETVQGGSTITQQYVKNTFFRNPSRTFERKAKELRLAIEVERRYTKPEILELYLNTVYFGNGAYGVATAAESYFGHGVRRLDVAESALLAALIRAPSLYDPRERPRAALARRNYVLGRMVEIGKLGVRRANALRRRPLGVVPEQPPRQTRYPYFVEAVRQEVLRDRRLGSSEDERARALYKGGLTVETTLDPSMQAAAEAAVAGVLGEPGDPAAALVAVRPSTGEIVAMVGGRDWSRSQVNLALGRAGGGSGRQPGSAFKPIAAAAALESGIPFDARYESSGGSFTFADGSTWAPTNAEGGGSGLMPLDEALVHSVNGVYARLALHLGPAAIVSQAKQMGVRSPLPVYPSVVLGTAQVSVLDMAAAYATLANGGTAVEPTTLKSVRTTSGELFRPDQEVQPGVVSPGTAYLITRALEDVIDRGTGEAAGFGRPAAGKTGTTNDYVDAWFVGYTPDLVAAVWVGYPEGSIPMYSVRGIRVTGGSFPALIWRQFMAAAHADVPPKPFRLPRSDLVQVEIDVKTGLLAASWCPGRTKTKTMLRQMAPTEYCPAPTPAPLPSPSLSPSPDGKDAQDGKDGKDEKDGAEATPEPEPSPDDGGRGKKRDEKRGD
ncbi:MAG TPA: PBP1A family penicillin-binding protein [Actinomycetota bacterium]|nr:PBP1A family penicillin-binding protein [Actinomycetota bacterium]